MAPDHEAIGINICENPNVMKATITKPEPADIPKRYGLANPFLSIPCKSAPDIPKDDPTSKEAISRGNRSSHIIVWFSSSPFLKIASQISLSEIGTVPLDKENIETIIKDEIRIIKNNMNLIFLNLIFLPHLLINHYCENFKFFKFKLNKIMFVFDYQY